jgi:hypothetical protein
VEEPEKERRVIINLVDHISWAFYNYDEVFDFQFENILYEYKPWGKVRMWDRYYYPICNELEDIWNLKMNEYLEKTK